MRVNGIYATFSLFALVLPFHASTTPTTSHTPSAPLCFKHTNPRRPNGRVPVPCARGNSVTESSSLLKHAVAEAKFKLLLTCTSQQTSCAKARDTFQRAFTILESYLILKENIIVNATFLNFCTEKGQCGANDQQVLGNASPANSLELEDPDGVWRLYPQALLKQLNLPSRPKYDPVDILCEFNEAADFHFPSDATPAKPSQTDMLSVVLHELIHGLGFTSSWDDYMRTQGQALLPAIRHGVDSTGRYKFRGFTENIFDRFMVEKSTRKPMSARTAALNEIVGPAIYENRKAFFTALQASPAAMSIGIAAAKLATTPNSLMFRAYNGHTMTLESSITPYATGSSVSHADVKTFSNTADFIMRFRVDAGVSLAATTTSRGGPIGPVLLAVLKTMGYTINDNPKLPTFLFLKSSGSSSSMPEVSLLFALWCICFIR